MKRLVAIMVVLFSIINLLESKPICAKENGKEYSEITDEVYRYLALLGVDEKSNIYISQPFNYNILKNEETNLVFVFVDEECIGELVFSGVNSSFFQEQCKLITAFYERGEGIAIIATGKAVEIQTGTGSYVLWGNKVSQEYQSLEETALKPIRLSELKLKDNTDYLSMESESNYLGVPFIANATSPDTNKGLCWLASCLSMVNYRLGNTGYTVLGLYNYLKVLYPPSQYGYPTGTVEFFLRAFDVFFFTAIHYDYGLTFSVTKNMINSNRPVIAVINNADSSSVHAVVVDGYSLYSSTGLNYFYYYRLMDPNCSSYVYVSVPSTGINLTYNAGYTIYTLWTSSYTFLYEDY